jgi:large subunit ribosomal protein L16
MLQPKRTKYRKEMRGKMRGIETRGVDLTMGEFGLKSITRAWIESKQLESARKAIVKEMKRKGKLWIRVFPQHSYTQRPPEVRMGKGKGDVAGYVAVVKPGRMLFELSGVPEDVAREALRKAAQKLPVLTKFITKDSLI